MSEHTGKIRVSWNLIENLLGLDNICEKPTDHGLGCVHSGIEIFGVEQPLGYSAVDFKVSGGILKARKYDTHTPLPLYEVTVHDERRWLEVKEW